MTKRFKNSVFTFLIISATFLFTSLAQAREFKPGYFTEAGRQTILETGTSSPDGNIIAKRKNVSSDYMELSFYNNEDNSLLYTFSFNPKAGHTDGRTHDYTMGFSPNGTTTALQLNGYVPTTPTEYLIDVKHAKKIYEIQYGGGYDRVFWYYSKCGHIAMIRSFTSPVSQNEKLIFVDADLGTQLYSIEYGSYDWAEAWISSDGQRVEGYAGSTNFSFPVPTTSIPDDSSPTLPAVNAYFDGLIDAAKSLEAYKTLDPLAMVFLSSYSQPKYFPTVSFGMRVANANRDPITGLSSGNFQVKENGAAQSSISVQAESPDSPLSIVFALDTSGSISTSELSAIKSSAGKFIDLLGSQDRAAIIKFASNVSVVQNLTSDKTALKNAINASDSDRGWTSLYDAAYQGISLLTSESGRKRAVVILTDGYDNDSSNTLSGVTSFSVQNNIPVFTIGLGSPINVGLLQQLADNTQAIYFNSQSTSDLDGIFSKVNQNLHNRYIVSYTTNNPTKDGSIRTVDATVTVGSSDSISFQYQAPQGIKPQAFITSISPSPGITGENITFQGTGTDTDGSITEYSWRSSINGQFGNSATVTTSSLSEGNHTIYFKVKDNDNLWSDEVSQALTVKKKRIISGTIQYENRIFNETAEGNENATNFKPARFAHIEVLNSSEQIIGESDTDENGNYSIQNVVTMLNDIIYLKCYSRSYGAYNVDVQDSSDVVYFNQSGAIIINSDTVPINLDIAINNKAGAFNILDNVVDGMSKTGLGGSVTLRWDDDIEGSAYSRDDGIIRIQGITSDPDEYDDSIILHELGHYFQDKFSYNNSPGGTHNFSDSTQDPRLSLSEGWGSFLSSFVRDSSFYIDIRKNSDDNDNNLDSGFVLDLENTYLMQLNPYSLSYLKDSATGQDAEAAVSSILWDIYDTKAADDDPFINLGFWSIWDVFSQFNPNYDCVLEDFYNLFLAKPANEAYKSAMNELFSSHKVFYSDETFTRGNIYETNPVKFIPDGDSTGIESILNIPDNLLIEDVNVFLNIADFYGEIYKNNLLVKLTSPSGEEVIIHNHTGMPQGYSQDIFGWYQPYEAISAEDLAEFNNELSQGDWKLKVIDDVSGSEGILNTWRLEIKGRAPEVTIELKPGWNMFSLPFIPQDNNMSIASILYSINGSYDQITRFNSQTQEFEYYVGNSLYDDFTNFEYGRGYLIYITAQNPISLTLTGTIPEPTTINLKQGWNLIGFPKIVETAIQEALVPLILGIDYSKVARYNNISSDFQYYSYTQTDFTTLKPAESYFIWCLKDRDWTIEP